VRMELQGSRVLLTGASGNLGGVIAKVLHAQGATVIATGRNVEVLEGIKRELGDRVELLPRELVTAEDAAALVRDAGVVDILVLCAGISPIGPLVDHTDEEVDNTLDLNVRAGIHLARAVLPAMLERRRGHLVFISSVSGKAYSRGRSLYSATGYGLRGLAGSLRLDLSKTGVGVTTLMPGPIATPGDTEMPGFKLDVAPERVAKVMAHAIRRNKAEVVVGPLILRAAVRLTALAPRLGPPSPKDVSALYVAATFGF
jgi:short-subunit dehydrogenase